MRIEKYYKLAFRFSSFAVIANQERNDMSLSLNTPGREYDLMYVPVSVHVCLRVTNVFSGGGWGRGVRL